MPGHTDEVYCVDFVADKIVSGGRDKTVKMYAPPDITLELRLTQNLDGRIRYAPIYRLA